MLNFLFKIVSFCRKTYWFLFRPATVGVKILAVNNNKVLLIKNRYDKFWYLPGGGVKSGETFVGAAKREMMEETGIQAQEFKVLGLYSNFFEYKSDHIILLHCDVPLLDPVKGLEVKEVAFLNLNNLPDKISPATKRRIEEFICGKNNITNGNW